MNKYKKRMLLMWMPVGQLFNNVRRKRVHMFDDDRITILSEPVEDDGFYVVVRLIFGFHYWIWVSDEKVEEARLPDMERLQERIRDYQSRAER